MSDIVSIINGAAGSAQGKVGTTVQTFVISLAAGFVLFGVQFGAFLIVRNYLWAKRIYQPRSFLILLKDRVKPPPNNPFKWIVTVFKTPVEAVILPKAGMDAYFFLRYLSMCLKIFFPLACVILPILIPLNYVDGRGTNTIDGIAYNVTGLDTLAWSNVSPQNTSRYWAHLILAIGVIVWVCFLFHRELIHFILKRQDYLGSASHRLKASSTTVLITDIPEELCTSEALTRLYDDFPGGVRRIWLNRDYAKIVDKDVIRKQFEDQLENAETNLIRKVVKRHRKKQKQGKSDGAELTTIRTQTSAAEELPSERRTISREKINAPATLAACKGDLQYDLDTKAAWTTYVKPNHRQTMRIPKPNHPVMFKIPIIGRFFADKVDTIYYCRRELARLNQEIDEDIEKSDSSSLNRSAFIQFNTQKAAHLACQAVADSMPRHMSKREVEISPADINWSSLNYSWGNRALRLVSFLALFTLVVFVFGLISFFTGILSRVSTLAGSTSWLHWIEKLPRWLLSFIQGTLPAVILVIVLSGPTPIVLRAMTNSIRGATTASQGERSLQLWYLILLVLELFIIPTVSSGLTSVVQELIHTPTSVPNILATYLPTAANYFFSFLILQSLSISASSILQTIRLLNFYVIGSVNTPDSVFQKLSWTNLTRIGSNIPWYTTFAVIGLVYSVIAPLILVFVLITFGLFYVVIKNNVLYVVRTGNVDSGGLWFPQAINQTFLGLYFMEICLIGLFFLVRDAQDNVACEVQGIIMAFALVLTAFYQIWLTMNFSGLFRYAPLRVGGAAEQIDKDYELESLTLPPQSAVTGSERTVNDPEKSSPSPGQANTSTEKEAGHHEQLQSPPRHFSRDDHRRQSTSHQSIMIAERSKDIQNQQTRDNHRAKHILARLNRPLDETRLAELETTLAVAEARIGNTLIPHTRDIEAQMMNDPISKIIMQHHDELDDLDPEERDMLISVAFTHPVLRETRPSVWIPTDDLGVSDDEVRRTRELSENVAIDNRGAFFDRKLHVEINKPPPDMSEFALVMAEL